jgi:hypothetical protein
MSKLSSADRDLVTQLREAKVFQDVADNRLEQANGIILVACGDGDELPELLSFIQARMSSQELNPRIHLINLNGGALLIPKESPVNSGEGDFIVSHVLEAAQLKGISSVALYVHAPCGKARTQNLTLEQIIFLLFLAKQQIQTKAQALNIACFIHINKGDGNRRTYYVSRTGWEQFVLSPV